MDGSIMWEESISSSSVPAKTLDDNRHNDDDCESDNLILDNSNGSYSDRDEIFSNDDDGGENEEDSMISSCAEDNTVVTSHNQNVIIQHRRHQEKEEKGTDMDLPINVVNNLDSDIHHVNDGMSLLQLDNESSSSYHDTCESTATLTNIHPILQKHVKRQQEQEEKSQERQMIKMMQNHLTATATATTTTTSPPTELNETTSLIHKSGGSNSTSTTCYTMEETHISLSSSNDNKSINSNNDPNLHQWRKRVRKLLYHNLGMTDDVNSTPHYKTPYFTIQTRSKSSSSSSMGDIGADLDLDLPREEEEEEEEEKNDAGVEFYYCDNNNSKQKVPWTWLFFLVLAISLVLYQIQQQVVLRRQRVSEENSTSCPAWRNADEERVWNLFWGSGTNQSSGSEIGDSSVTSVSNNNNDNVENEILTTSSNIENDILGNSNNDNNNLLNDFLRPPTLRDLGAQKPKYTGKTKLVIAGKMTVDDGPCNIAEMDLDSKEWSLNERVQLSLYNSYSGGEVYYLLANHTFSPDSNGDGGNSMSMTPPLVSNKDEKDLASSSRSRKDNSSHRGRELIVVGAFDTTDRNSQVTYCSVGAWDGTDLNKVGEGLCNSALSKGMKITTAALAGPQDVFVAGSFMTQVWNGDRHEFVKIFNIAHYNAVNQVWMPLSVGQITCSWCTVTVLALSWDSTRRQLHVAGKFNAIDGRNIPSGLAIYDQDSGHLVAHPGGGLTMFNATQDGVGTALQLDEKAGVLYVMGSFERLGTGQICYGLAAYEINAHHWTCLADAAHTVMPSGGGNMLLTPYGLMVAGRILHKSTWPDNSKPYTIALLKATPKKQKIDLDSDTKSSKQDSDTRTMKESATKDKNKGQTSILGTEPTHDFEWSWLPGFKGHDEPLHTLANGFGEHEGAVFIAGDNLVAKWYLEEKNEVIKVPASSGSGGRASSSSATVSKTVTTHVPVTINLSLDHVKGAIMAIAQLNMDDKTTSSPSYVVGYTIAAYLIALGALLGMFIALLCNSQLNQAIVSFFISKEANMAGISLDMLSYSANVQDTYLRAMRSRSVEAPPFLQLIDPQSITLHRIIGEGTFGRVWSARLNSASVAVKEFVFAQAAVAGRSSQQDDIIEEIIGEAGMMSILRHPNVLQLFGCSLTAQAIWIVSELCSLGSLRQLLDDTDREISLELKCRLALQVAEGMMYLHSQDPAIIHRDLKSHNILVHETFMESSGADILNNSGGAGNDPERAPILSYRTDESVRMNSEATTVAKIGDWGSARATLSGSRTMTHGVGTACWLAPEVIKHARSSKSSDVYSYGIILWELATREEVYAGLESTQIIAQVANDNLRPPIPNDYCPWTDLMEKCWEEDPENRPTFSDIVTRLNRILVELAEDSQGSSTELSQQSSQSQASYQTFPIHTINE